MIGARGVRRLALFVAVASLVACGKRGAPLPPLRPVPVAVADFTAERSAESVTLRLTVPDANLDRSTPPKIDSVEIYAMTQPASAPAPTPPQLAVAAYRIATIPISQVDRSSPKGAADTRPRPGEPASFVDKVAGSSPESPQVRYYAATGLVGRRSGPVSAILSMPLGEVPQTPAGFKVDYTENNFVLTWSTGSAADHFIVEERDAAGGKSKRLAQDATGTQFMLPIEFGRERCFAVRAVKSGKGTFSLSQPTAAQCVTASDHFPPQPPTSLQAFASDGAVDLLWTAPSAPDLAGYVVLRAEGADGTLQRLTTTLVTTAQYKDQTVRAGVTYAYQVVAADKATPPNMSEGSNRVTVTAR